MFEILRQVSSVYKCILPKFHTLVFDFPVNQLLKIDIHAPLVSLFWACVIDSPMWGGTYSGGSLSKPHLLKVQHCRLATKPFTYEPLVDHNACYFFYSFLSLFFLVSINALAMHY